MLVLYIHIVLCRVIHFAILYEKLDKQFSQKLTQFVISKILDEYNAAFSPLEIEVKLDSILSFNEYSLLPEYRVFTDIVGNDDLGNKAKALDSIDNNLIVLFSAIQNPSVSDANRLSFCKGRYFVNLNNSSVFEDILSSSVRAFREWIGAVLKIKVPEFHDLDNFSLKNSISESTLNDALECHSRGFGKDRDGRTVKGKNVNRSNRSGILGTTRQVKEIGDKVLITSNCASKNLFSARSTHRISNNNSYSPLKTLDTSSKDESFSRKFVFPDESTILAD